MADLFDIVVARKLSGGGGGGGDIPTFIVTFDSNYETILSVTCDKTYTECYDYCYGNVAGAIVQVTNGSGEFTMMATFLEGGDDYVLYTGISGNQLTFDLRYNSDGTIVSTNPSAKYEVLNVTQNGTYYASDGFISEVNVNV